MKNEFTFSEKWKLEKLVNCLFNPEHVKKWDKIVKQMTNTKINDMTSCGYTYVHNHKQF